MASDRWRPGTSCHCHKCRAFVSIANRRLDDLKERVVDADRVIATFLASDAQSSDGKIDVPDLQGGQLFEGNDVATKRAIEAGEFRTCKRQESLRLVSRWPSLRFPRLSDKRCDLSARFRLRRLVLFLTFGPLELHVAFTEESIEVERFGPGLQAAVRDSKCGVELTVSVPNPMRHWPRKTYANCETPPLKLANSGGKTRLTDTPAHISANLLKGLIGPVDES